MKKLIYSIILVPILTIALITNSSFAEFDTAYARKLQTKLEQVKFNYALVGISAAVNVPGQGEWFGTAGISHPGVNITSDITFDCGSITKNFMAALTLQLVEEDSLSLTDSIGTWLPQYPNINGRITIRQLLNHSSGIYNFTDNPAFNNALNNNLARYWALEEVLTGGYVLAPYFAPGGGWRYSNTNYIILAIIIRQITGSSLSSLFRTRFFDPLDMNESGIELEDTINAPFVHGWAVLGGVLTDISIYPRTALVSSTMGAGGVISRPLNMIKWSKALYTGQILNQASLTQMLTFVSASISGANGYGLGTMRYNIDGRTCWGHAGNSFGHSTVAIYSPTDSICMTLMMNRDLNTGQIAAEFLGTVFAFNPIGILSNSNGVPLNFQLHQNYPNPFNPSTNISFDIPPVTGNLDAKLSVFDAGGRAVDVIFSKSVSGGSYSAVWNAGNFASGIYFYRLELVSAEYNSSKTMKMALVK